MRHKPHVGVLDPAQRNPSNSDRIGIDGDTVPCRFCGRGTVAKIENPWLKRLFVSDGGKSLNSKEGIFKQKVSFIQQSKHCSVISCQVLPMVDCQHKDDKNIVLNQIN